MDQPNEKRKKNANRKNKEQGGLGRLKTSSTNVTTILLLFYLGIGVYGT
jgi:hypothetical protein